MPILFLRVFNEAAGRNTLAEMGASKEVIDKLEWMGISGIGNMIAAIKCAK